MMAASANMFHIAVDYKEKTNMKVAASNTASVFQTADSWYPHDHCTVENLRGLDTNLLLNNVETILVKITIKLILILLPNSCFNTFIKMKNE